MKEQLDFPDGVSGIIKLDKYCECGKLNEWINITKGDGLVSFWGCGECHKNGKKRVVEFENCYDCPMNEYEHLEELPMGMMRGRHFCKFTNNTLKYKRGFPEFCPLPEVEVPNGCR